MIFCACVQQVQVVAQLFNPIFNPILGGRRCARSLLQPEVSRHAVVIVACVAAALMVGGIGAPQSADTEIQAIVDGVREEVVRTHSGRTFEVFAAIDESDD